MRPLLSVVFAMLLAANACGAAGTPTPADTLHLTGPDRTLRYTYANDFFHRTDYYFTQGMTLSLVHPGLARLPTQKLLAQGPAGSTQYHGVTLHYDGFTPLRIQDAFIRVGDRPYAAYLYATFSRVNNQPARRQRLTSALELGFIGPAAGGKQLQTAIHRATNNLEPRGWDYQIRTDAVVGYALAYERQLFALPGRVEVLAAAEASLSTLRTYAGTGLQLRAGLLQPYFSGLGTGIGPDRAPWQLYAHISLEGRLIGYDATLQGGVFNRSSPYVLAASAVRRTAAQGHLGVVLAHGSWSFSATSTRTSPEFAGARSHRWGQLGLTRAF